MVRDSHFNFNRVHRMFQDYMIHSSHCNLYTFCTGVYSIRRTKLLVTVLFIECVIRPGGHCFVELFISYQKVFKCPNYAYRLSKNSKPSINLSRRLKLLKNNAQENIYIRLYTSGRRTAKRVPRPSTPENYREKNNFT